MRDGGVQSDNSSLTQGGEAPGVDDDETGRLLSLKTAAKARDASVMDKIAFADALWTQFRFGEALCEFEKAAQCDPSNAVPLLLAAKRLFALGRFAESGQFLSRALERQPQESSIRRMLAEILARQGKHVESEALAREALLENPADARTVRALANTLRAAGRIEEAIAVLRRHLVDYPGPESWRIQCELAGCLDRIGDYESAIAALFTAKAQLRPFSQPFLNQWHARTRRRQEFAHALDKQTLHRWSEAASELQGICPVAILAGHPRSGTTLLEQMLAAHPQIVTTDETGILRSQFIEATVMAADTTETAVAEINAFDVEQLEAGRTVYFRATEAHVGEPFLGRTLIEKDPLATWDLGFMLRLLPEARVIFPLRDPRDVCVSYFFTLLPLNPDSAPALDLASTCAAAAVTLRLWKHWRDIMPQRWMEVRYERLVQAPRDELMPVMKMLELPWDERMLAKPARPGIRGIRTPTYADVAEPLYTRAIGRWRHYARWLEPHMRSLAPLLKEFGYE